MPFVDPVTVFAVTALVGLLVVTAGLLRAWLAWVALKERELERRPGQPSPERGSPEGAARIELADLRERIRKLEAIADGLDH
ncbi:hypothetical protein EYB45_10560 [Erythrobacteraceae bacterium CFH 75059]|uniref:hypothetical protein n=1 Tax=Qipengyuania thermophila TaxID=2509361 RepID=UPI0010228C43|nr:hypothetical protein [Qipengyuania thermophila]TCD01867.1 hypothetical protein EYB45_10560 [Erythrobacteraceae bacterium CFH 75059]